MEGGSRRFNFVFSGRIHPEVSPGQDGRSLSYSESWEPYSGMVYCATVSTGFLVVRRNLKVAVSGNSPFEHQATPCRDGNVRSGNFRGWCQYRQLLPRSVHTHFTPADLAPFEGRDFVA